MLPKCLEHFFKIKYGRTESSAYDQSKIWDTDYPYFLWQVILWNDEEILQLGFKREKEEEKKMLHTRHTDQNFYLTQCSNTLPFKWN